MTHPATHAGGTEADTAKSPDVQVVSVYQQADWNDLPAMRLPLGFHTLPLYARERKT